MNVPQEPLSTGIRQKMSAIKRTIKPSNRVTGNEWIGVIASLDEMMAKRVSFEMREARQPSFSQGVFAALDIAYAATVHYYRALLAGENRNSRIERAISRLWQKTGTGIRKYDPELADRLKGTNAFWVNDVTWEAKTIQEAWVRLNSIRVNANRLSPDARADTRWSSSFASTGRRTRGGRKVRQAPGGRNGRR